MNSAAAAAVCGLWRYTSVICLCVTGAHNETSSLTAADVRQHRNAAVSEGLAQRGHRDGDVLQRRRGDGVPEPGDGRRPRRGLDDERAQ